MNRKIAEGVALPLLLVLCVRVWLVCVSWLIYICPLYHAEFTLLLQHAVTVCRNLAGVICDAQQGSAWLPRTSCVTGHGVVTQGHRNLQTQVRVHLTYQYSEYDQARVCVCWGENMKRLINDQWIWQSIIFHSRKMKGWKTRKDGNRVLMRISLRGWTQYGSYLFFFSNDPK